MGRKTPNTGTIGMVLVVILVLGGIIWAVGNNAASTTGLNLPGTSSETQATPFQANCPDDGITTLNIKIEDDGASTTTFIASSSIFAKNLENGVIESNTTSSSSAWATMDVSCGKSYKIYATTQKGVAGSAESKEIQANENNVYVKLHSNQLSKMQVRVKDKVEDAWEFGFPDGGNGANSTSLVDMNTTSIYDDAAKTANAIGSDGYLDLLFQVKSATTRKNGNDQGKTGEDNAVRIDLTNYMCVDLNGATNGQEWDSDELKVSLGDGIALPNKYSEVDAKSKEQVNLQLAEACYDLGDINDVEKEITFYIKAKSAQDPDATDDDINVYFFSEGTYRSSEDNDMIKTGIYTDASTQATVVSSAAEVPKVVIEVS